MVDKIFSRAIYIAVVIAVLSSLLFGCDTSTDIAPGGKNPAQNTYPGDPSGDGDGDGGAPSQYNLFHENPGDNLTYSQYMDDPDENSKYFSYLDIPSVTSEDILGIETLRENNSYFKGIVAQFNLSCQRGNGHIF